MDNRGSRAAQDLERYRELLRRTRRDLELSEPAALLLLDVLKGTVFVDAAGPFALQSEIADAIYLERALDTWFTEPEQARAFLDQLAEWSPVECLAIVDGIEHAWELISAEGLEARAALHRVGLLR
jgi:hypothetical protein